MAKIISCNTDKCCNTSLYSQSTIPQWRRESLGMGLSVPRQRRQESRYWGLTSPGEDWVHLREPSPGAAHLVGSWQMLFFLSSSQLSSVGVRAPGRPRWWWVVPLPCLIYTQGRGPCRSSSEGEGRHSPSPRIKLTRTV